MIRSMDEIHILVVEDEASIAEVVSLYLKRAGYVVHIAPDGKEALAIFQQLGGSGASEAAEVRALLDEPHPASGPNQRVGSGQSGPARHSRQ